ncbi:DUF6538 domain-containing protein [Rubrivivax gelatinosus]|uniref:DUF6538 domain-containing protein n=1 Tax=Rubrivivax gelatinosus TaxID=28068 RepID=UPI0005C190FC|nr:DUF6538 domain-containing protein [Rubrivivax gelatinosus]MBG6078882.1 integrase [Rubrivivax gelatinosus]
MADMAKRVRYVTCKEGRFYFRRRVPDELQERFGRKEISEALGDVSKAQAVAKVNELAALWDRKFLDARHELGLAENPAPPQAARKVARRVATKDDAANLARAAAREVLARDEQERIHGIRSIGGDLWLGEISDLDAAVSAAVAGDDLSGVWPALHAALRAHGLALPAEPAERRALAYAWAQQKAKALQAVQARGRGEAVETPPPPAVDLTPPKRMRDAFNVWKARPGLPEKTIGAFERHLRMFEQMAGDPPLHLLRRAEAKGFQEKLQAWAITERKTARTADNVLVSIRALAEVARLHSGEWIAGSNPFEKLTIDIGGKDSEGREPWTAEELTFLFAEPLFARYDLPAASKAGGPAAYWVPLLATFTGARASEMCQLWTDDLSEIPDSDGAPVLVVEFRENPERGQKLKKKPGKKNSPSWRAIPVHSELLRLGFRDYWQDIKRQHGKAPGPLFPLLPREGQNGAGGQFSGWFSDFKIALGFASSAKCLHSFRHTVITELALAGADGTLARALTGHAETDVHGETYSATVRREAVRLRSTMERLCYPSVKLPRVYPVSEAAAAPGAAPEDASAAA